MNKRVRKIIALTMLIALGMSIVSCQGNIKVRSLLLKKMFDNKLIIVDDYECNETTLIVDGKIKLDEDEKASIKWIYCENNTIIYEETISLDNDHYFQSKINNGDTLWPVGQYCIEVYINEEKVKSLDFNITQMSKENN